MRVNDDIRYTSNKRVSIIILALKTWAKSSFNSSTVSTLQSIALFAQQTIYSSVDKRVTLNKNKLNKKCVINDPLGHTHRLTSSDHYFYATFVLFCDVLKNGDVRTETCAKIMIPTGRYCGLVEWIKK